MAATSGVPHYFTFYTTYWRSAKVKRLSLTMKAVFIELLTEIHMSELKLEDDDELVTEALGITMELWLEAKELFLKGNEPLIYVEDGYLLNEKIVTSYNTLHTKIEKNRAAGKAGGAKKKGSPVDPNEITFE